MSKSRADSNTLPKLGELELQLLNALWEQPEQSAKDLHTRLDGRSGLNTVQSALERLYKKSLLQRQKQGHAYAYSARVARSELTSSLIGAVIDRLQLGNLEPVLSSFVDFAEGVDDTTLNRLEKLIQERKQQRLQNDD